MNKVKLNKEEFSLFKEESRYELVLLHGHLVVCRKIRDKIEVSVYELYEFYVKTVRSLPDLIIIEVKPVTNLRDLIKYLNV